MLSDIRLKTNLILLCIISGIKVYRFDYINGAKNQIGVIAQEIKDITPNAVTMTEDGYYMVNYSMLPANVQNEIYNRKAGKAA